MDTMDSQLGTSERFSRILNASSWKSLETVWTGGKRPEASMMSDKSH